MDDADDIAELARRMTEIADETRDPITAVHLLGLANQILDAVIRPAVPAARTIGQP